MGERLSPGGLTPRGSAPGPRVQRFGPRDLGAGRFAFNLWAPAARTAALEIKGRIPEHPLPMAPQTGTVDGAGWFRLEAAAQPGALYRFRLDDAYTAPDPAARALAYGLHGWSVLKPPGAYPWRRADWSGRPLEECVFYEAHAGLLGGFAGVERRLSALADLGVTAVELMPVSAFPGERNWGYDGVFPFAPAAAYGEPDALKSLVDTAHGLGIMMILDVVYNHFGPDGNALPRYAPQFFRTDRKTAWGGAIDLSRSEVLDFFVENALYWIEEFRFDGLRLDAVHAFQDPAGLQALGRGIRAALPRDRHVHLILENDDNDPTMLPEPFDAQWNDDFHHVLHVLLTGETDGYYGDFASRPAARLARALSDGFIYQGEPSIMREGGRRGGPSRALPATAFVNFLQNHDQTGNRAFGERLTRLADPRALEAAIALLILTPALPLIFMGEEEAAIAPFLYFTDHDEGLAAAVREGRRAEFRSFPAFADPERLKEIPDPNASETFAASRPDPGEGASGRRALYKTLLALRRERLSPRLAGARVIGSRPLGLAGACCSWSLSDGTAWSLAVNLGREPTPLGRPLGRAPVFSLGQVTADSLGAYSFTALEDTLT